MRELAPELDVLIGSDDTVLEVAIAGAKGWVSGYTNAFPRSCVQLYQAAMDGDIDEARPAVPRAASVAAVGLQDRVRAGDQALDGHRRALRRALPPTTESPSSAENSAAMRG